MKQQPTEYHARFVFRSGAYGESGELAGRTVDSKRDACGRSGGPLPVTVPMSASGAKRKDPGFDGSGESAQPNPAFSRVPHASTPDPVFTGGAASYEQIWVL